MADHKTLSWPQNRLGEVVADLSRRNGLDRGETSIPTSPPPEMAKEHLSRWLEQAGDWLGIEIEPTSSPFGELEQLIRGAAPALLSFEQDGELRFLALNGLGGKQVELLTPSGPKRAPIELVRSFLAQKLESRVGPSVDRMLDEIGIKGRQRRRVRQTLIHDRVEKIPIGGCFLLRSSPGNDFVARMRQEGLGRLLARLIMSHAVYYFLFLVSWWMIGRGILQDRLDWGWMAAWGLVLLSLVPFQLLVTWLQGRFALGVGGLLKQRLLLGAMKLRPEEIRHMGSGQLLGRVIESEAVESLALAGGFSAVVAVVELVMAGGVLALGAGGLTHLLTLVIWSGLTVYLGWRYYYSRREWTESRLDLTHDLVERMLGHRTRLAQESREQWHAGEDQALERYVQQSAEMDRAGVVLHGLIPRGWLLIGFAGIALPFSSGSTSPVGLAISLGGLLLAFRALSKLTTGLANLNGALISWSQIAFLFKAAARPSTVPPPEAALVGEQRTPKGKAIIEGNDLVFRYADRPEPILKGCDMQINAGDQILLEGPSGCGKSTLAALLVGLREPNAGLLLLGGNDRYTLGAAGWRRSVVSAPQFHENHVLTETFAFNLLMGRGWPPEPEDLQLAEQICHELGLGPLLERMPAGLMQMVGETGWQLSHGEKSRLFIARALLQRTELVLLDESFAALDPETLERCLTCVLDRAPTLLVIAHP